jgi:hypothetical protein
MTQDEQILVSVMYSTSDGDWKPPAWLKVLVAAQAAEAREQLANGSTPNGTPAGNDLAMLLPPDDTAMRNQSDNESSSGSSSKPEGSKADDGGEEDGVDGGVNGQDPRKETFAKLDALLCSGPPPGGGGSLADRLKRHALLV